MVLRDVGLKDRSGRLGRLPSRQSVTTTVLRAGQLRELRLALSLPLTTPAGEYAVELDILGESRGAKLYVSEAVSLRVEPSTLWVENRRDGWQTKTITVANAGNAPARIADLGDVPLRDDLAPAIDIGEAIQDLAGKPDLRADEVVDVLVLPSRRSRARVGSLSLSVPDGQVTVAPGEARSVEVGISLPEPPPPGMRARARVPLMNATLDIVIFPSGETQPQEQPDETPSEKRNRKPAGTTPRRKTRGRS
ncbi:MAG TPA: hypothetical protein VNS34_28155 [Rhizobiaceae bacterium]|nr:hypothetical protein [Rhizobiaceae bacterium]